MTSRVSESHDITKKMAPSSSFVLLAAVLTVGYALPGGLRQIDIGDKDVLKLAQSAVTEITAKSNSFFAQKLVKVTDAKVQVVSGLKYLITFDLGTSDCLKSVKNLDDCSINKVEECHVEMWVQQWLDSEKMTKFDCDLKSEEAEPLPDADEDEVATNPEVLEEESNEIYDSRKLLGASAFFQQARGNVDSIMNQIPNLPAMPQKHPVEEPQPPKKPMINLGGDDHDIGNYGAFQEFKTKYNKEYEDKQEHQRRFKIFRANMKTAWTLNEKEQGSATYGATAFADLSADEFSASYLGLRADAASAGATNFLTPAQIPEVDAPDAWDWREEGAVTEVKNQGMCGSCWAFSTTGNVEGQYAIKTKNLTSLSEQELVDCDKLDEGCNGGLPILAYQEIIRLGGLETETDYPYEAEGEKCAFVKSKAKVDITGAVNISSNEDDMKKWLYQNGPISIGINAMGMQFYMGGISHPFSFLCDPESLDHGVLIVGYGVKSTLLHGEEPYWIIKNSWGPTWGEEGYYLVYRGGGVCGVNRMATSSVIN